MRFRRRAAAGMGTAAALAIASTILSPGTASADIEGCPVADHSSHCYAVGMFGWDAGQAPVWLNAVYSQLEVDCLWVSNPGTDFVDHEMWMSTNDNNPIPGGTWVESGMTFGTVWDYAQRPFMGFSWFWADRRPDGSYYEHFISSANAHDTRSVAFYWVPNTGNWDVYLNGSYVGTSTNNGAWAGGGSNGVESTTPRMQVVGNTNSWEYADPSNRWFYVPGNTFVNQSNGLLVGSHNGQTVNAGTWNGCGNVSQAPTAAPPGGGAPTITTLSATAARVAGALGEPNPSSRRYVKTTRGAANGLDGTKVNTDQPVYLIEMNGAFSASGMKTPPGKPAPKGTVATITVDAATGGVVDWGIGNSPRGLPKLGNVAPLT